MRVTFLSDIPCAFFVNGLHAGQVDGFERQMELSPMDGAFCEGKAEGFAPVRFRFNEALLFAPPEGIEVYLTESGAAVRLRGFTRADASLRIVWRQHFAGCLLTLCVQGNVTLLLESARGTVQHVLPFGFANCRVSAAGSCILLEGEDAFALLTKEGGMPVLSRGRVVQKGERVTADVPLSDALSRTLRCTYENGTLTACRVLSARTPDETDIALALFESVLEGLDPAPFLAPALINKAGLLREFLGGYTAAVPLPGQRVGLVFPVRERVFEVRPFCVTLEDGKVANIRPA